MDHSYYSKIIGFERVNCKGSNTIIENDGDNGDKRKERKGFS